MKNLISTLALAIMMITSLSAFSKPTVNPLAKSSSKHVISVHLETLESGNLVNKTFILDKNFEFYNPKINHSANKKEYVRFLKDTKNLTYNCQTSYEILDETSNTCVAKSTMKFEDFTRIDYITLKLSEDGWKINKVVTTYP